MKYSRTADLYRLIEACTIGPSLQRARIAQIGTLAQSSPVTNALLIGEGDGRFLAEFVQRFPAAKITVIDESERMLQLARKRLRKRGLDLNRVEFITADIGQHALPDHYYDVIVTHFFFDNFLISDVADMMAHLNRAAAPNANWLIADFFIPKSGWRRYRARIWLRLLYIFFGISAAVPTRQLPQTEEMLRKHGFQQRQRETFCGELIYSTLLASPNEPNFS
jgi:ubiquinone/menaquinone biosynthesis C-methylase UbiE